MYNIAFTGHRNKISSPEDLEELFRRYPTSTWVHGGAIGFDSIGIPILFFEPYEIS
jgi:hypothetical protein